MSLHIEKGRKFRETGEYEKAIKKFKLLEQRFPFKGQIFAETAWTYEMIGEYDKALENFRKAMKWGYDSSDIISDILRLYRTKKEYKKALEEITVNSFAFTQRSRFHMETGRIFYELQQEHKALLEYKKALELGSLREPNDKYIIHLEIGYAYYNKRKYRLALKHFTEALKINGDSPELHQALGRLYMDKRYSDNDFNAGMAEYKKAASTGYSNENFHIEFGIMCRENGEKDRAVEEFKKAEQCSSNRDIWFKNKILNEIEISQGKTILKSQPRMLYLIPTSKCNISCIMCNRHIKSYTLPYKFFKKVVKLFKYTENIAWQGGEVFLVDYFKEVLLKAAGFSHLNQIITTNGLLIDNNWAEIISDTKTAVEYSIDSITPKIYENIRKGAIFSDLIKSIKILNARYSRLDKKPRLALTAVVMKKNLQDLKNFPEFCMKYGFDRLCFDFMRPNLLPEENIFNEKNQTEYNDLKKIIEDVKEECQENRIEFDCTFSPLIEKNNVVEKIFRGYKNKELKENNKYSPEPPPPVPPDELLKNNSQEKCDAQTCTSDNCTLPWKKIFVDYRGWIKPDCICKYAAGNIVQDRIEDIWNNKGMQAYRQKILLGQQKNWCIEECLANAVKDNQFAKG